MSAARMDNSEGLRLVPDQGGLVAKGLGKRYKKRPVVRGVSINRKRGEAVGLLGPNGAGKTTTFYMMTGLVRPDEGQVFLDGHDVTLLPMYVRSGYIPAEEAQTVCSFDIDDYTRWRLLEGLDDIGITLGHEDAILDYEHRRHPWKPTTANA